MEKKEMEIVRHTTMNHLEVFIVEMTSRGPHGHDDFELGMILEGTMTLFLEQEQYHLKAGDIQELSKLNPVGRRLVEHMPPGESAIGNGRNLS